MNSDDSHDAGSRERNGNLNAARDPQVGLLIARRLIAAGVPVFAGPPVLDATGAWLPTGGAGGYWLPVRWQRIEPDERWLDPTAAGFEDRAWRPGWALCAVMGHRLDLLDVDPRNGGVASRDALVAAGRWPNVYGLAATPSGGTHEFVAPLGARSRDGVLPGLDVKAGRLDGSSRGFAFIEPTVRVSKVTGEPAPYLWLQPPEVERVGPEDASGSALAILVDSARPERRPAQTSPTTPAQRPTVKASTEYERSTLTFHARLVAQAEVGSRRNTLNKAAFALAQQSHLDEAEVRPVLLAAAASTGLPALEAEETFRNAWRDGSSLPRSPGRTHPGGRTDLPLDGCWQRGPYRDFLFESALCPTHKLLLLAVLSFISRNGLAWPSQSTLGQRASMSRGKVSREIAVLRDHGWLQTGSATWCPGPGPKPKSYWLPAVSQTPVVPDHCTSRNRTANLRRGVKPEEDSGGAAVARNRYSWHQTLGPDHFLNREIL
jgi:hypothetical protein